MKYRPGRVHALSLVALAVIGLVLVWGVVERAKVPDAKKDYYDEKVAAAERTSEAMWVLKTSRRSLGWPIEATDPYRTGLIGHRQSPITTSGATLEKKLRSLDPNISAVFVELLHTAEVRKGDRVAVGVTGSFPLLNIAMLVAIETLGAEPVVIASVGSSRWGANDERFTWLHMERVLRDAGLIKGGSVAASLGGGNDRGGALSSEGKGTLRAVIDSSGVALIAERSLRKSALRRMAIYDSLARGTSYRAYVNIGGGLASKGKMKADADQLPQGLSTDHEATDYRLEGVVAMMAERGVPIINVLGPQAFIKKHGLPDLSDLEEYGLEDVSDLWSSVSAESTNVAAATDSLHLQLPLIGKGSVYKGPQYSVRLAGILAILYGFLIFVVVRIDIKHYLFRRPSS